MPAEYLGRAESFSVNEDENGFEIHFSTDDGGDWIVNIQAVISQFLKGTEKVVDYVTEGAFSAAYPPSHDGDIHSIHADIWDAREKGA